MTTIQSNLIRDAQNHLNGRQRGKEARLQRLAEGGVPTDLQGMNRWLEFVLDFVLDAQLEAAGGVYHACTVRVANGCDADLQTKRGIGCRISRVPIRARRVEVGDVLETDDDGEPSVICDEPFFVVNWGLVGTGFMAPSYDHDSATTGEAEAKARANLLARGDCFETRVAARAAVEKMLDERASVKS